MTTNKPEERIAESVGKVINKARTQAVTLADETFPVIEQILLKEAAQNAADEYALAAIQAALDDVQRMADALVAVNQLRAENATIANVAAMKMKEVIHDSVEIVEELTTTGTIALNLRVWMTADPEFISRVLSLAVESARNGAVNKLTEETRLAWLLALILRWQQNIPAPYVFRSVLANLPGPLREALLDALLDLNEPAGSEAANE